MKYQFVKAEKHDRHDTRLTLLQLPNWFDRLFGAEEIEVSFYGSCTVWRHWPSCRRCDSDMERMLSEFHECWEHGLYS